MVSGAVPAKFCIEFELNLLLTLLKLCFCAEANGYRKKFLRCDLCDQVILAIET